MDLSQFNVVVIVFTMPGCPACSEYVPRFQQVAQQFSGRVPSFVVDSNSQSGGPLADRLMVTATPTTLILRKPTGAIKAEGALPSEEVAQMFQFAAGVR